MAKAQQAFSFSFHTYERIMAHMVERFFRDITENQLR
jgi:hypothetical protein